MKKVITKLLVWTAIFIASDIIIVGMFVVGANDVLSRPLSLVQLFINPDLTKRFFNYQGLYIFIVAIIIGYNQKSAKDNFNNATHGSARWAKISEIRKVLNPDKGIILAKRIYLDLDASQNKNIMVIGSSGTGKSRGFIKPNVLQMNGSYIITDPKGEIFDDTSEYLKSNGYNIKVLNLVNLSASDLYNPLAYISEQQDLQVLAKTIIDNTSGSATYIENDSFWNNSETALLTALLTYVIHELPEKQRNLASVLELLLTAGKGDKLDELFFKLPDKHKALTSYKIFCLSGDPKTRGNIMIGLGVRLQVLQIEGISRLMSGDTLNINEIAKSKTAVYVITSDSHRTYDFISSMFFSQLFQILYLEADKNGGKLGIPVICLLDEFSNIGKIPDFSTKAASMRSRGINVSIVIQSLGQIKAKYEKQWSDIMGNCDTLMFLGAQDIETARFISERLGKSTIANKSRSFSMPTGNNSKGSKTESEGRIARPLLTPDEVTRLNPAKSIIFVQGLYPILSEKYDLQQHKAYKELKKVDHNQYSPEFIPEYDTFKPIFPEEDTPKEQKQPIKKPNEETQKESTKEVVFFDDNTAIFENADFGRNRDEGKEISW